MRRPTWKRLEEHSGEDECCPPRTDAPPAHQDGPGRAEGGEPLQAPSLDWEALRGTRWLPARADCRHQFVSDQDFRGYECCQRCGMVRSGWWR